MHKRLILSRAVIFVSLITTLLGPSTGTPAPAYAQTCNYQESVLADNPLAYWRLGEASGAPTAVNIGSIGSAVDGAYTNGVTLDMAGLVTGDSDSAASFDGTDDYVSVPNHEQINIGGPYGARTIELWFRADDLTDTQVLFEEGGDYNGINIFLDGDELHFGAWENNVGDWVTTTVSVDTGYHVALVFDGSIQTVTGYLNGVSIGTSDPIAESIPYHEDGIGIGSIYIDTRYPSGEALYETGDWFDGVIDEVALYNRALSPVRIQRHAAGCSAVGCDYQAIPSADGPTAYWRLGETSGTAALNISSLGSVLDGTYTNLVTLGAAGLVTGDPDTAASFDGVDDYVSIPSHEQINIGGPYSARTIELWFRANDLTGMQALFKEGGYLNGFNIFLDDDALHVGAWENGAGDWVTTTVTVDTGYHVAMVFDGSAETVTGYLDGVSMGTSEPISDSIPYHQGGVSIGALWFEGTLYPSGAVTDDGPLDFLNGTIDEVVLYNTVLTPERIQAHALGCGTPTCYALSLSRTGEGSVPVASPPSSGGCPEGEYVSGASIGLSSAVPETGWEIGGWTGTVDDDSTADTNTVTMPASAHSASVDYTEIPQYTLTVNTAGNGSVTLDPSGGTYYEDIEVTLTADPDTGWSFSGWSGDLSGANNPETIIMDANREVTATFTQDVYTLTVNVEGGGSVEKDPDVTIYYYGATVVLTATADPGWTFSDWSGDLSGANNPETITMDASREVTATFAREEYNVQVTIEGNGTVNNAPGNPYYYEEMATLTPVAVPGWSFAGWSGRDWEDLIDNGDGTWSVSMDDDKKVTATFSEDEYTLTVNVEGSGSVEKDPDATIYYYGATVVLTATADPGWTFSGWSGDLSGNANPETITMDASREVTATFTQDEYTLSLYLVGNGSVDKDPDQTVYNYGDEVMLTPTADPGWTFSGWFGDLSGNANPETITINGDQFVIATFTEDQYTLTVNVEGSGSVEKDPDATIYYYGATVVLTATADPGWTFSGWSGELSGDANPETITMDASKAVTATFAREEYDVKVTIEGNGTVNNTPGNPYYYEETATLTPLADPGWSFAGWSGRDWEDLIDNGDGTWRVSMDDDKKVTATFNQDEYTLTVNVEGDGSVDKAPDETTYYYGATVVLTATADPGWFFVGWSGDLSGNANPETVTIDASKEVTATFGQGEYYVMVTIEGNGTVSNTPGNPYYYEDMATLTPLADLGWSFAGWSGPNAGELVSNPDGTWSLEMDGTKFIVATFTQDEYTLAVNVEGNGSVGRNPDQLIYHYGDEVDLTATADPGWTFSGWSGELSGANNPETITMDASKAVTATFTKDEYTLTVNVEGDGSVDREPDQAVYYYGDEVELTATADPGWTFSGWSGDLSANTSPETITMDASKEVTATFTEDEYTLTLYLVGSGSVEKDPDSATYNYGDEVELTATADPGWTFSGWFGDLSGHKKRETITMDGDKIVIATFTEDQYTLTVNVEGSGSVGRDPDHTIYYYDDEVELTATADPGWIFIGWSGDLSGSASPATITMDGSKEVTATFVRQHILTVNRVGNGSIDLNPPGSVHNVGTVVELSVAPDAGWSFDGWSGPDAGDLVDDGDSSWLITMNDDKDVTATFVFRVHLPIIQNRSTASGSTRGS